MKELNFRQMESVEGGSKMACGAALTVYAFSFVALCATTGLLAICAVVGYGASLYDVFAAC
jgi:hypothetical protein